MRYLYSGVSCIDTEYNSTIAQCEAMESSREPFAFENVFVAMESDTESEKKGALKTIGGAILKALTKIKNAFFAFLKGIMKFGKWVIGLFGKLFGLKANKKRKDAVDKITEDAANITEEVTKVIEQEDPDINKIKVEVKESIDLYKKVIDEVKEAEQHQRPSNSNHQGSARAKANDNDKVSPGRTGENVYRPKNNNNESAEGKVFNVGNRPWSISGKKDPDGYDKLAPVNKSDVGKNINKLLSTNKNLAATIERNEKKLASGNISELDQKKARNTIEASTAALRVSEEALAANVALIKSAEKSQAAEGEDMTRGAKQRARTLKGKAGKKFRAKMAKMNASTDSLSDGEMVLYELSGRTPYDYDLVLESILCEFEESDNDNDFDNMDDDFMW